MATKQKLTKEQTNQLAQLGIKAKDAEEGRQQILKKLLDEEGIEGLDEDPLDELLDTALTIFDTEEEIEATNSEEEEYDEAADEDEDEDEDEEEDDEEEDDEEEELDLSDLSRAELKEFIADNELGIKILKKYSDDDIRDLIREALGDGEEEELEEAKPAPKAKAKAKKPSNNKAANGLRKVAFSKDNKAHVKLLTDGIGSEFTEDDVEIKFLKKGMTAYLNLESSKRALFSFDMCSVTPDETVSGHLFFNALKGRDEVEELVKYADEHGLEFKNYNQNLLYIPNLTMEEATEALNHEGLFQELVKRLERQDKKAVASRKKMEETMAKKSTPAPAAEPAPKKTPAKKKK